MIIKHLFKNVFSKGESGPEGGFEFSFLANEDSEVPGPLAGIPNVSLRKIQYLTHVQIHIWTEICGSNSPRSLWLIISVSWIWSGKLNQSSPIGAKAKVVRAGSLLRTAMQDTNGCGPGLPQCLPKVKGTTHPQLWEERLPVMTDHQCWSTPYKKELCPNSGWLWTRKC